MYHCLGESYMKGRTKCPECKHEFVLDIPATDKKHKAVCPECNSEFTIKVSDSHDEESDEECYWEEHGEPRKTILSSIKPHTNKPKTAAIILVCVFAIGLTTAVFSESFIETSLGVASSIGLKGDVEIKLTDKINDSSSNLTVTIDGKPIHEQGNGIYKINTEPKLSMIEISKENYPTIKKEILVTPFFTSYHQITLNEEKNEKISSYDTVGCSIIIGIFSVFALFGTIACLKRKHFNLAVVGSIVSIFSFGFFMIGSILCIIALVIIIKAKDEFDNGKKGKIF